MYLHEYQSKEPFAQYAIAVPEGRVASSPQEAVAAAPRPGGSVWVVKTGITTVRSPAQMGPAIAGRPKGDG
jgi:succinyl-CoA synthetase beta subunit